MKLNEAIEEYLFYIKNVRRRANSTIKTRKIYLSRFADFIGDIDVSSITNRQIDQYHADMQCSISERGKVISISTVNCSIRGIKSFINFCNNYLEVPTKAKSFSIYEIKQPEKHPDIIFFSDVKRVVEMCNNRQDRLMIALTFEAGLRIQELCNVRVEDFRSTTLDVVGKGDKHRITFMSDELRNAIDKFCRARGISSGYVFRPLINGGDHYTNSDTVRMRIKAVFRKTIGMEMHPHQLRHAFAINLLENGTNIRSIQKLLGHSKLDTTMKYLGISDKYLKDDYISHFGGSVLPQAY